jgi:hypothetical protein
MTDQEARVVRDERLAETDKLMLPDYPITPAGRLVASKYRQDLRDWPDSPGFPDIATLPQLIDWAAYSPVNMVTNASLPHVEGII